MGSREWESRFLALAVGKLNCPPIDREDFLNTVRIWSLIGSADAVLKVVEVYEGGEGSRRVRNVARQYCGSHFPVIAKLTPMPTKGKPKRTMDSHVLRTAVEQGWSMEDFAGFDLAYAGLFVENPWRSLAKYAKVHRSPDEEIQRLARQWVYEDERPFLNERGVSSHETALNCLDPKKSPGPPFNRVATNTGEWLEKHPDHLLELWDALGSDSKYCYLWGNSEKEEMRAAEKLADRKIRTFVASSKEMVYVSRRLFGSGYEAWVNAHRELNHGIGFNKFEGGWDSLVRKLAKFPNCFGADVDGRDGSVSPEAIAWWTLQEWRFLPRADQTPANRKRFVTLLRNRSFSLVVDPDGFVWYVTGGNKSGDPKTIQINTWQTREEFYYAWIKLVGSDRSFMRQNCAFDLTGDDVIFSVSDEVVERFNFTTVASLLAEDYGVVWTTDFAPPRHAMYVPYLSSTSVIRAGLYVPIPTSSKMLASWLKATKSDTPAMSLVRSWAFYRELYWDVEMRSRVKHHIDRLMRTYSRLLKDDPDWQLALTCATTADEVEDLWGVNRK